MIPGSTYTYSAVLMKDSGLLLEIELKTVYYMIGFSLHRSSCCTSNSLWKEFERLSESRKKISQYPISIDEWDLDTKKTSESVCQSSHSRSICNVECTGIPEVRYQQFCMTEFDSIYLHPLLIASDQDNLSNSCLSYQTCTN